MTPRLPQSYAVPRGTVVPARVGRILLTAGGLAGFAAAVRGQDPEVDAVLAALSSEALAWTRSARTRHGLAQDPPSRSSSRLSTSEAAQLAGCPLRTLQNAITDGRLPAEKVGKRFVVTVEDAETFAAARRAA